MTGWEKFEGKITGIKILGDKTVSKTYPWNRWFLRRYRWQAKIFHVWLVDAKHGYRVGLIPGNGKAKIINFVCHDLAFAMIIGNEDCTFFAVKGNSLEEIKLLPQEGLIPIKQLDRRIPHYCASPR